MLNFSAGLISKSESLRSLDESTNSSSFVRSMTSSFFALVGTGCDFLFDIWRGGFAASGHI